MGIIVLVHVITCFLQIDIISSLLSGRLVREEVGPVMFSAVHTQVTLLLELNLGCSNETGH